MFMSFVTMLCSGLFWHNSASAEAVPDVVVDDPQMPCTADFSSRIIRELNLRSSAQLLSSSTDAKEEEAWELTLERGEGNSCEIRLQRADKSASFVLTEDADELEIVSIATRMAWIIDGIDRSPSAHPLEYPVEQEPHAATQEAVIDDEAEADAETEEVSLNGESPVSDEPPEDQLRTLSLASLPAESAAESNPSTPTIDEGPAPAQTSWVRNFSVEAVGGAMWLPSADINLMMVRTQLNWQPWSNVSFGLAGRLPIGSTTWESGGMQYGYHAWSLDLLTTYSRQISRRWGFAAGGGIRRTVSTISAFELSSPQEDTTQPNNNAQGQPESEGASEDFQQQNHSDAAVDDSFRQDDPDRAAPPQPRVTPDESEHPVQQALTPWSVVATARGNYFLTQHLAVGLEATVATSLTERTIRDDQRVLMDLGRLEVDLLLGLELRF